jgi:hypothetical protein
MQLAQKVPAGLPGASCFRPPACSPAEVTDDARGVSLLLTNDQAPRGSRHLEFPPELTH